MERFSIDYEHEAQKDYIFQLEREKDIEASWQQWEEKQKRKPAKIETNEIFIRSSSFRRTVKKVIQLRSHFSLETNSRELRHQPTFEWEYED